LTLSAFFSAWSFWEKFCNFCASGPDNNRSEVLFLGALDPVGHFLPSRVVKLMLY
jgi:hypothetical protein